MQVLLIIAIHIKLSDRYFEPNTTAKFDLSGLTCIKQAEAFCPYSFFESLLEAKFILSVSTIPPVCFVDRNQ